MHHSDVGSKGVCYGLASRLRYVRDLPLDPSEAVDDFVAGIDMPTRELPGGRTTTNPNGMETRSGGTDRPGYPLQQQQQQRDFHSQQRHPPQDQQHHRQQPNMRNNNNNNKRNVNHDDDEDWNPQTMVYGQLKDRQTHPDKLSLQYNNNNSNDNNSSSSSTSPQDTIPHNESDEKVTRLRAVGCTHIEVLVLEGTKRRKPPTSVWSPWRPKTSTQTHPSVGHVLALAADCTHGVHYVDAATSKARETYTQTYCFALAPFFSHGLHIHFAPNHNNHRRHGGGGGNGDLENRLANDTATAGLVGALTNSVDGPTAPSTNSVGTTAAASMQHNNSNNNTATTTRGDNDYNNNHHHTSTPRQDQNTGRISHETILNGTARLFRAVQYGTTKLWGSMRTNALLVHKSATRPDYPSRVVQSGEKIIRNFPKTFQRTTKLMGDVYKLWTTDDDDDDNNNGNGRGGW